MVQKYLFCEIAVSVSLVSKTFTDSEIIGLIHSQFEESSAEPRARGHGQCCIITFSTAHEQTYKTKSAIFISLMCYLLPEDLYSEFVHVF